MAKAKLGQRGQKRMIRPLAVVGEVGPLLTVAVDLFDGGVQIDGPFLLARPRHAAPDLLARPIDDGLELLKVMRVEASEEVAGGGGIGDAAGPQQMLDGVAVLQVGDVLDAPAADVLVVDVREDVVGLEVGKIDFEQREGAVDVPIESQSHGQVVGERQASVGRDLTALLDFDADMAIVKDRAANLRPEHRLILMSSDFLRSGALADAFGSCRVLHLKGLLAVRCLFLLQPQSIAA